MFIIKNPFDNNMSVTRGLIFSLVSIIPAMIFGLVSYIILGGVTSSPESSDFMFGPCYGVPFSLIIIAFIYGFRGQPELE
jgi:hypothetical protein|tara:strand:- start:182 stop:421 length:240 start_codon:yes stop_codon:yes gene_type:complete